MMVKFIRKLTDFLLGCMIFLQDLFSGNLGKDDDVEPFDPAEEFDPTDFMI